MEKEGQPKMTAVFTNCVALNEAGIDIDSLVEAVCPQLDVACYKRDQDLAKRGLYEAMRDKARAINKQGVKYPFQELVESAAVFKVNRDTIRRRLVQGRIPQSRVVILVK